MYTSVQGEHKGVDFFIWFDASAKILHLNIFALLEMREEFGDDDKMKIMEKALSVFYAKFGELSWKVIKTKVLYLPPEEIPTEKAKIQAKLRPSSFWHGHHDIFICPN